MREGAAGAMEPWRGWPCPRRELHGDGHRAHEAEGRPEKRAIGQEDTLSALDSVTPWRCFSVSRWGWCLVMVRSADAGSGQGLDV